MPQRVDGRDGGVARLRAVAAEGRLSPTMLTDEADHELRQAAYTLVWPLVWHRHTWELEIRKRHPVCASALCRMRAECLDSFHDDVESVIEYLFNHGGVAIRNLEGWVASRITVATVDGHRKRRGARGAQQRIRVPRWLAAGLGEDVWLVELAGCIIEWVGIPGTAGTELWPLDAWAARRRARRGGPDDGRRTSVAHDVERVLSVMRTLRPAWHAKYIEGPLGCKTVPVASTPTDDDRSAADAAGQDDSRDAVLAVAAADALHSALAEGADPVLAVVRVLRGVFLDSPSDGADLGRTPGEGAGRAEWLLAVLADQPSLARLACDVLDVVDRDGALRRLQSRR